MTKINLTPEKLAELRKVAEEAQKERPGPWEITSAGSGLANLCDSNGHYIIEEYFPSVPFGFSFSYFASFDPPTVIALLDRVEENKVLKKRVEELEEINAEMSKILADYGVVEMEWTRLKEEP